MQIHFWVIIGQNSTRKGSTIRALTGVGRGGPTDVMLTSGQSLEFSTAIMSGNEGPKSKRPKDWLKSISSSVHGHSRTRLNVLAALRLDMNRRGFEVEDYLDEIIRQNCIIEGIVTLGETTRTWVRAYGAPYAHVRNVDVGTNAIAARIRQFWGWR